MHVLKTHDQTSRYEFQFMRNCRRKVNVWIPVKGNQELASHDVRILDNPSGAEEDIIGNCQIDSTILKEFLSKLLMNSSRIWEVVQLFKSLHEK